MNLYARLSAALVNILKVKGYLLNISAINRYSLLLNLKKSVARSYYGTSGTSLGSSD